eukprot:g1179.t1
MAKHRLVFQCSNILMSVEDVEQAILSNKNASSAIVLEAFNVICRTHVKFLGEKIWAFVKHAENLSVVCERMKCAALFGAEDEFGKTPLHIICSRAEVHLDAHAMVAEKVGRSAPWSVGSRDHTGRTPLHILAEGGRQHHLALGKYVKAIGRATAAKVVAHTDDTGLTALHLCCKSSTSSSEGIEILLGASPSMGTLIAPGYGTALHLLCGNIFISESCLQAYLNLSATAAVCRTRGGKTPLHLLCKNEKFTLPCLHVYLSETARIGPLMLASDNKHQTPRMILWGNKSWRKHIESVAPYFVKKLTKLYETIVGRRQSMGSSFDLAAGGGAVKISPEESSLLHSAKELSALGRTMNRLGSRRERRASREYRNSAMMARVTTEAKLLTDLFTMCPSIARIQGKKASFFEKVPGAMAAAASGKTIMAKLDRTATLTASVSDAFDSKENPCTETSISSIANI